MEDNMEINDFLEGGNYQAICENCLAKFKELYQQSGVDPQIGDMVKVDFRPATLGEDVRGEVIWVFITARDEEGKGPWFGTLGNTPGEDLPGYKIDQEISFHPKDICLHIDKGMAADEGMKKIMDVTKQVQAMHNDEDHGSR
jgi:hypothetical protein